MAIVFVTVKYEILQFFTNVMRTLIRFFSAKFKVLLLYANGNLFLFCLLFYSEIRNFAVLPKRWYLFYRKIPDFENYSHTVIAWIKHLDIFQLFSTISLRHKWNGTRLVSPKNESTSCRTTSPISGLTAHKRKKRLSFDYEVRNF